jgi:hypothetical protein
VFRHCWQSAESATAEAQPRTVADTQWLRGHGGRGETAQETGQSCRGL